MTVLGYIFRKLMHYFYKIDNYDLPANNEDLQDTAECEVQGFQFTHYPDKNWGTISGIVKNMEGCPIENALIQVFDSGDEPVTHGFTNDDGQYRFYLEHGNYILKAVR